MSPQELALKMIQNIDTSKLNPMQQNMIDILKSNDAARGEEFARNLCKTYGISEQEATVKAKELISQRFPGIFR